jgi:hypothetical protein
MRGKGLSLYIALRKAGGLFNSNLTRVIFADRNYGGAF